MKQVRPSVLSVALILLVTLIGTGPSSARADQGGKTPIHRAETAPPTAAGTAQPVTTGGTTLVLLGLLLGGAILVRRLVQQRTTGQNRTTQAPVTLLGKHTIDRELTVRLLQIGSRVLVVGSSPQGLATLTELTNPDEIAPLAGEAKPSAAMTDLFAGNVAIGSRERTKTATPPTAASSTTPRLRTPARTGGGT